MARKVIAFANQKGGVGKTTSCVNIAASMVVARKKVLLIDLDPQGNATMGSGINKLSLEESVTDALLGQCDTEEVIITDTPGGYHLLPGNSDLTAAEVSLLKKKSGEKTLANLLAKLSFNYDFVLLDCPPSLNMLTLNALVASSGVIIPMQCEYYALEGLSALLDTIKQVKSNLNPGLKLEGIIRTMFDPRNNLAMDVSKQLKSHFSDKLYKNVIPRNVRLAEAPSHGVPALLYDKNSKGAAAYLALTGEIIRRSQVKTQKSRKTQRAEAFA